MTTKNESTAVTLYLQSWGNFPTLQVFPNLADAVAAMRDGSEYELDDGADVQLGLYIEDETDTTYYSVTEDHGRDYGMNCKLGDVTGWRAWWDEAWSERFDSNGVVMRAKED